MYSLSISLLLVGILRFLNTQWPWTSSIVLKLSMQSADLHKVPSILGQAASKAGGSNQLEFAMLAAG